MPAFWFSLMAILVFSLGLGWLPATQMRSLDAENLGLAESVFDVFRHMILPVCVLGLPAAASTARYTRHSVAEVLQKDYIRAARAKGLPERSILWWHVLRNAGIPLITLFGLTFPFLLGGSVIVETIFSWPGMGRVAIEAIYARDYPVLIASAMVGGVMVITGNFFADLLYAVMDPRVRVDRISMN
jgi:peptide/nickel transport system permease protein